MKITDVFKIQIETNLVHLKDNEAETLVKQRKTKHVPESLCEEKV